MPVSDLETGPLHLFSDFATASVPTNIEGVYTIWDGNRFIYVGIGGTQIRFTDPDDEGEPAKPVKGLRGRLDQHRSAPAAGTSSASISATDSSYPLSDRTRSAR